MNFYIWAFILTAVNLYLVYSFSKYQGLKIKSSLLILGLSFPLCPIINLLVKRPIFDFLFKTFKISNDVPLWPYWFHAIAIFIAPLTEEAIKVMPIFLNFLRKNLKDKISAISTGFLLGFGFGLSEAWFLAYFLTKKKQELAWGSFFYLIGFFSERFTVVFIHAFLTSLVVLGIFVRKPIKYYLIAVLFHTMVNVGAGLFQAKIVSIYTASFIIAVPVVLIAIYFTRIFREIRKEKPFEEKIHFKI